MNTSQSSFVCRLLMWGTILFYCTFPASPATADTDLTKAIAIENDWPPYYFGKNGNTLPGFARELIDHCAPSAQLEVSYEFFPVKRMYSYLQKGEIDIAIFSYKESRKEFVVYGKEPIFISGYRPVVLKSSNIQIKSLGDFDTLKLGHLAGLEYSPEFLEYIHKRKKNGSVVTTTIGNASLRMLLEKIIDVFVDTRDTVLWRAKQLHVSDKIEILDFDIKTSSYFITISKKSPRISSPQKTLDDLDNCIKTMKENGIYKQIAAKYGIQ